MLSEHIFFVIESISDVLKVDKERNEILTLCKKPFLELLSDDKKWLILKMNSDDEIREILELYSDDEKKEILKWYLFDPMDEICKKCSSRLNADDALLKMEELCQEYETERIQKLNSKGGKRKEFIDLYLPGYKTWELKNMYRVLSHDDKQEFLHNYTDCWRNTLLKYLEFRQNHSVETLFDIITLLMEGKEVVVLSKDVKEGIVELQKQLWFIYKYVGDVEAKYDDSQMLSEYEPQLYHNLSYISHSSDDILDRIMSNDVAHQVHTLLETIHNFYTYNPSFTGTTYLPSNIKVVVKNIINSGGHQSLANMNFTINRSMPLKDKQNSRPKSYGHVRNSDLVGFNDEIETLRNHLLQSHDETKVVGIVGPGGAGKTTLAKHIYHRPEIISHFSSKVWVCISQSWDKTTILKSMWRQATQNPKDPEMGYEQLVECLSELLRSKSYLVILDDIWSVDAWYDIYSALPSSSGSKVVVTTRNKFLPRHINPGVLIVEPKQLNDKECYELFKKEALLDENVPHELQSLGMEMVKKCKGLPLAVVALAGVLRIDKRPSSWETISKKVTDKMLNMKNDSTQGMVKEILALSYYELPEHLKPCALYLRVFPEDYVINAQQLIQMWMAECFMDEEDEAQEYLDELAQRSIVEVVKTNHKGQVLQFQIHDLIREMFINIYEGRDILKNQVLRLAPRTRRFGDGQKDFDSPFKILNSDLYWNSHARSLLFLNVVYDQRIELRQLFIKFKLLRVLVIDDVFWSGLPEEIGNLIHLRYLQLGGPTKHLPGSIGNLENLLTLHLRNLVIPGAIATINLEKLKELRHLNVRYCKMLGLEKLKKLKTFRISITDKRVLSVMSKLSDALQELSISTNAIIEEVVFTTPSITANNLQTLELCWFCEVGDMSMMSKCQSITKLELDGKIKEGTPLMFPPNLIHLKMKGTYVEEKQVMNIISNSCPLLKILILEHNAYNGTELVCNQNSFPQLEKLELNILTGLKSWIIERGAMPRLNALKICGCQSLEVNDKARELISKIAPSLIPILTSPGQRKAMDQLQYVYVF